MAIRTPKLRERDLQAFGEDLLILDRWRIFNPEQHFNERSRKLVGEAGAPDTLAIRYAYGGWPCHSEVLFIEWKSASGRLSTEQRLWHTRERGLGAVTWIAKRMFDPTPEGFFAYYVSRGLMRRNMTMQDGRITVTR